jgi:hypothetical protein
MRSMYILRLSLPPLKGRIVKYVTSYKSVPGEREGKRLSSVKKRANVVAHHCSSVSICAVSALWPATSLCWAVPIQLSAKHSMWLGDQNLLEYSGNRYGGRGGCSYHKTSPVVLVRTQRSNHSSSVYLLVVRLSHTTWI